MKITQLRSENVKRITLVEITPGDSPVIKIGGENMAGKSSVLDSVMYAIGGEKLVPSEPIRTGEARAEVVVELDGGLKVTRRFTRDRLPCDCGSATDTLTPERKTTTHSDGCASLTRFGETRSTLTVTNKDGAKYPSPQAMLDKLIGKLAFDPLDFYRMKDTAQNETLRKLLKLDFTELTGKRKEAADNRAMAKKGLALAEARAVDLPSFPDVKEEVPSDAVAAELKEAERLRKVAEEANKEARAAAKGLDEVRDRSNACGDRITKIASDIQKLQAEFEDAKKEHQDWQSAIAAAEKRMALCVEQECQAMTNVPSTDALEQKLQTIEQTNKKFAANQVKNRALDEVVRLSAEVAQHDKIVTDIDTEKERLLREAAYPVPGLGLSEDGVTFNGLPFNQASGAERLRVSVAMGLAMAPELKVLLVRDGSLLDAKGQALVAGMAEAAGAQVWMEIVGEGEGMAVVMEDGHAK
jgi:hypothetical protein